MEMRVAALILAMAMSGCATPPGATGLTEVVVQDFESREPLRCTTADVDLDAARVREFFARAHAIDYRTLAERHEIAPCALLGNLRQQGQWCDWKIRPGGIGQIECAGQRTDYLCEQCDDLYATGAAGAR